MMVIQIYFLNGDETDGLGMGTIAGIAMAVLISLGLIIGLIYISRKFELVKRRMFSFILSLQCLSKQHECLF